MLGFGTVWARLALSRCNDQSTCETQKQDTLAHSAIRIIYTSDQATKMFFLDV